MDLWLKNIATLAAVFLVVYSCKAQNLIPNPGFENVLACPTGLRQLELAEPWSGANAGTPELFHRCGYHANILAHSGDGLAGIILLSEASSMVEYLQIQLLDSLEKDQEYKLSFYIKLSRNSLIGINKIGVLFSKNGLYSNLWIRFSNKPQIVFNEVVDNTTSWRKLERVYKAKGGEKYITFGNFFAKHFVIERIVNKSANDRTTYYFLDDFYLAKQSVFTPEKPVATNEIKWSHVVYFEKDSSTISKNELLELDLFIQQLPNPIFFPIKIEGHTDQDASFEYNLQLSQARAVVVQTRMSNFNLRNIYTTWSGENEIVYEGEDESGKTKNRRVTITVER